MSENKILVLDPALCNQIAAGEVLERASSAVKELVENSLDAGATRIEVEIIDGGRQLIQITDNGCGMSAEDARLSLLRHATSKISSSKDLEAIASLGFRGEALASMSAVSKMRIMTQERGSLTGTILHVEGSRVISSEEYAGPEGTRISIREIFYNTPARLKFLKTSQTESRRVYEVMEQMALAYPEIHFKLTQDERIKLDLPPHSSLKERTLALFGRNLYEKLYPLENLPPLGECSVSGLISSPDFSSNDRGRLYIFVNQRAIKDKTINAAISAAYKEFLHGKFPCAILNLQIPFDQVDVNVHPTKSEVRFQDQDIIFRTVYRSIRETLSQSPWISPSTHNATLPRALVEIEGVKNSSYISPEEIRRPRYLSPFSEVEQRVSPMSDFTPMSIGEAQDYSHDFPAAATQTNLKELSLEDSFEGYFSTLQYLGQLSNTYLLALDQEAMVLIDQHAAHERINFERLKSIFENKSQADVQNLLFPLVLELDTRLAQTLEEYETFFSQLGLQIDPIGENSFALKAVPSFLIGHDYDPMIREALTDLSVAGRSVQISEIIDELLANMACHGSVRAGMPLTRSEVRELFRLMDDCLFKSNCPHGRPVHIVISQQEIEKRFQRR